MIDLYPLDDAMRAVFADRDILPTQVPQLDLYMDQILEFVNARLE